MGAGATEHQDGPATTGTPLEVLLLLPRRHSAQVPFAALLTDELASLPSVCFLRVALSQALQGMPDIQHRGSQ